MRAEDIAVAQGHTEVADLLSKLSAVSWSNYKNDRSLPSSIQGDLPSFWNPHLTSCMPPLPQVHSSNFKLELYLWISGVVYRLICWVFAPQSITSDRRDPFVRQLLPTKNPIDRIKMKVFGSGGVGKTTLIESLKCGYFRSFFRRAYAGYNTPRFMKGSLPFRLGLARRATGRFPVGRWAGGPVGRRPATKLW